jgi:hypothetical protein
MEPLKEGLVWEATRLHAVSAYSKEGLMFRRFHIALVLAVFAVCSLSVGGAAAHPPGGDAIITNGVVQMGIHNFAHLNVPGPPSSGGTPFVGLRYVPTNAEATAPGCLCEGWGVADAGTGVTGYANEAVDGVVNLTPVSFVSTPTTALSVVLVGTTFQVTHDYHPSASPNLYESVVTIQNISTSTVSDVRYRRVMDWDVEPTAFSEFVTIETGTATALLFSSDNGFASANPLAGPSSIAFTGEAVDNGPLDHGALFDFGFGSLAPGASVTFRIFYGGAGTETEALNALSVVGAEVYSLGQCNSAINPACSEATGTPNTFIFAFAGVGGTPIGCPPPGDDDDGDGLTDENENRLLTLLSDSDSDDDGIVDGNDDSNGNGEDDEDEDDDDECPDEDEDADGEDDEDEDDD